MIKRKNISRGKVQNMMNQGAFKYDLTLEDLKYVEEFMYVEVGYEIGQDGIGVCPSHGAMTIGNEEFYYKGKEYGMIRLTFNNEIVLIGKHGGLVVKWKNILKTMNSKIEVDGKVYDTKTAKFINRRVPVIKEEPVDAMIFDFYQTPEGIILLILLA